MRELHQVETVTEDLQLVSAVKASKYNEHVNMQRGCAWRVLNSCVILLYSLCHQVASYFKCLL